MRRPEYLSPSALKTMEKDPNEYYVRYLSDHKAPRLPQTQPMSVGSAFDAYIKSYLHNALFGHYGDYVKEAIFEKQVEPHNRDWAREAGQNVFDQYLKSGAAADLMLELQTCVGTPRFEFDIKGEVETNIGGIPLLGKPDVFFMNDQGARVILDWKVNGYCGRSPTSPRPGYVKVRDGWRGEQTKNNMQPHKDCWPSVFKGIKINPAISMEDVDKEWADQECIYAWLLGEPVGSENLIVGIEQICGTGNPARLRMASHRCRVKSAYQYRLQERIEMAWSRIVSGHFFTDLTKEESDAKCAQLDEQAQVFSSEDEISQFVSSLSRRS